MTAPLALLLVNAVFGAWDTLWYHEYRAQLPKRTGSTRTELQLHAARDAVYVGVYGLLAWVRPGGWLVAGVTVLLATEIVITLTDFVVEDRDRPAIGGVAPGERVLHSVMAIVYGAMLCSLIPILAKGVGQRSTPTDAPRWMSIAATFAAIGIAASGLRDAVAQRSTRGQVPL